ncbi:50S ribosomal protein L10 [Candidatus Omnitrophus magneticus]|uniref:Large ribosomal subunit protein uL10 n=1 Tax=Candidatus Omnitrophus magneticus TaxID=1609969 RepID=A0A0F0CN74_9BACT|nr:50S ribosomal protein L10 [Candidatus Omnitrophus magneticus]
MAIKYGSKVRELMVKELETIFSKKKGVIFASGDKIEGEKISVIRKKIVKSGTKYLLVKKRLAKIASKNTGLVGLDSIFKESKNLGLTVIEDDPVLIAKLLSEFEKENEQFKIFGAIFEKRILSKEDVKILSKLPSRIQLLTSVVGTMKAPISSFVGVMGGIIRNICYVLIAVKEKKEKV